MPKTHWMKFEEKIQSQYGLITAYEWCEKEVERLKAKGLKNIKILERRGRGYDYVAIGD